MPPKSKPGSLHQTHVSTKLPENAKLAPPTRKAMKRIEECRHSQASPSATSAGSRAGIYLRPLCNQLENVPRRFE